MIDRVDQLRPGWLAGRKRIGITSGASVPELLVRQVIERLQTLGAASVRELDGVQEKTTFSMPEGFASARSSLAWN